MNDFSLIYRQLPADELPIEISVARPDTVFKQVRQAIKPYFSDVPLQYENINGAAAHAFNRRIGRFRWDWLEFVMPEYQASDADYPSNSIIASSKLIQETEVASEAEWTESVIKQVRHEKIILMVGMECLMDKKQFSSSMLSGGIPEKYWPCTFRVFEFVITNAPICLFIQNRAHVIV